MLKFSSSLHDTLILCTNYRLTPSLYPCTKSTTAPSILFPSSILRLNKKTTWPHVFFRVSSCTTSSEHIHSPPLGLHEQLCPDAQTKPSKLCTPYREVWVDSMLIHPAAQIPPTSFGWHLGDWMASLPMMSWNRTPEFSSTVALSWYLQNYHNIDFGELFRTWVK